MFGGLVSLFHGCICFRGRERKLQLVNKLSSLLEEKSLWFCLFSKKKEKGKHFLPQVLEVILRGFSFYCFRGFFGFFFFNNLFSLKVLPLEPCEFISLDLSFFLSNSC